MENSEENRNDLLLSYIKNAVVILLLNGKVMKGVVTGIDQEFIEIATLSGKSQLVRKAVVEYVEADLTVERIFGPDELSECE